MTMLTRHHVAAGTFRVNEAQPTILQAYLGTCVGIALYCKETGVGGIIHLLLPEPISPASYAQPEKYATTGTPLFIQAMLKAGAQRESLSAYLAGGALVGPLSRQDLDLDIGGRTVEKVREILAAEKIAIAYAETGGFFTCCLDLNMTNGECRVEPAGYSRLTESLDIRTPSAAEIKQAMDNLKPIPQVALKVLRLMDQPDFDIQQVADEIRKDQVISARVLQLANSAMFAARQNIDSLDHALIFLGQDMLVKLILSAAVQSYFNQSGQGYSLCKGGLYYHAVGCAQVAEALARKTGKVDPGRAYTAGLLHDIGKVVLDQYVAKVYPLFYRKVIEEGESVMAIERRLFGIDHTEVGRLLAQQWAFPESLRLAIRYHHYPGKTAEQSPLAVIVYLADLLLSRFNIGLEIERVDTHQLQHHIAALDLSAADFSELVDLVPLSVFREAAGTATETHRTP
jgi:putative nucleotidyltransferase with HDIG domain